MVRELKEKGRKSRVIFPCEIRNGIIEGSQPKSFKPR